MVLAHRLMMGGAASSFTPPASIVSLTTAPDGAWTHASDPHAVYYNGVTYFGYIDMSSGNVEVRTFTHATQAVSSATVISAAWEVDNHAAPTVFVRDSDKRIMVFYTKHDGTAFNLRISTNAEDISAFGAAVDLDASLGGGLYTYPSVVQLLGETNDPIYLFYRDWTGGDTARLCYSKSTDGGATWSAQTQVYYRSTYQSYWKVASDGQTRIDIVTSDGRNPTDTGANSKCYHFYYEGGSWFKSDGTSAGSLPLDTTDMTEVYGGADGTGWPLWVTYLSGQPVTGLAILDTGTTNSWRWSKWTGSAWTVYTIASSAGVIEDVFAGSYCVDPADPTYAYVPIKVGSYFEMYLYQTRDGGATWEGRPLTSSSGAHNLTPVPIYDHPGGFRVLWLQGTYTDYLTQSMKVMASR